MLAVHHAAGVQKRTSQRKAHVSAKARRRREKGMEMAEAVLERTSSKVKRSWDRQRTVDKRRQGWDAVNKDVVEEEQQSESEGEGEGVVAKKTRTKKENGKAAERDEDEGWETDENDESKPAQTAVDDDLDEIM